MAEERKKSRIDDVARSIYDVKDAVEYAYKTESGLTEEIVREISAQKEEPDWMLEKRLAALRLYQQMDIAPWMPDISELDMTHIDTYVRPKTDMKARWEDLPENIRDTFDRLGIPEAEKKSLAGVGASMTRKWCTTMSRRKWKSRASSTWISRRRSNSIRSW